MRVMRRQWSLVCRVSMFSCLFLLFHFRMEYLCYHTQTIIAHIHHWSRNRIVKRITSLPMALPSSLSFNPALHPWIFTLGLGLFNVPHRLSQFFVWTGQGSTIAVNTALWAQDLLSCRHCMLPFSLVSATTTQQYIFISPQNICRAAMRATWSD